MKLAVCIPGYSAVEPETVFALMDLASMLTARGIVYSRITVRRDPNLAHARNVILNLFLNSDADRLIWVDTDVVAASSDVIKLVESERDYVGANYPRKGLGVGWASRLLPNGDVDGQYIEAEMLATGLCAMSRNAVSILAAASQTFDDEELGNVAAIVNTGVADGRWIGDDESICRLWRSLGGKIWLDRSIRCDHVGSMTFTSETACEPPHRGGESES